MIDKPSPRLVQAVEQAAPAAIVSPDFKTATIPYAQWEIIVSEVIGWHSFPARSALDAEAGT